MTPSHICKSCGTVCMTGSQGSLCPACMLNTALDTNPDMAPSPAEPGTLPRTFGAYILIEEIARGGMGIVYKARQTALNRVVALKVLVGGAYSSESLLRRFQGEAEAAAGLQHPGIVAIHEFGEHDNQPYYTMDFVEGRNLGDAVGGQPIAPERAARYLQAIAAAVGFAHEQGILHRDLKPSNILVDQNDRPRVADFGLAKRLHDQPDATLAGQVMGSPNYAPPEQATGRKDAVGVGSDVYSLGAILYYLLTGRPPFLAGTIQETIRLVIESDPVPPRVLAPGVPRDLETICLKCLEKDPARRYISAQALVDELGRQQRHEPILARPVSLPEQALRWCRRHPAAAAMAATVMAALTASTAVFYTSARRIDRARASEQSARLTAEEELYATSMLASSLGITTAVGMDPRDLGERLNASRPKPDERDLRGFEWRYFWDRSRSDALATLAGHDHAVDAAFFSPDGATLATHSIEGSLKLWDASTMKELATIDRVAVAGGFAADGSSLVFSRQDNSIWRIDRATGTPVKLLDDAPHLIAVLPDGRQAVVFGPDQLPVLSPLDATMKRDAKGGEVPPDTIAVVSADGRRAAVAGRIYPGILVIDLATHRQVASLSANPPVIGLALSPDGSRVVSTGMDGVLTIWGVAQGTVERAVKAFVDPMWGLAFSSDGRTFAAGGNNRVIKLWDASTWEEKETMGGHGSTIRAVAFAPDGKRLVSGAEDELAMVWSALPTRRPDESPQLLRGLQPNDRTPGIVFSPDGRQIAGTGADGTIKVLDTDTLRTIATFPMDARTVAFSPDGNSILSEDYSGVVQRWEAGKGQPLETTRPKASFADWQLDTLAPRERIKLIAEQSETRAGCRLCEISSARDGINSGAPTADTIAMSADGLTAFVGLPQGTVEVWDMRTGDRRFTIPAHKLPITALAVSDDGHFLATGSLDNSTKLWEAATGRLVATFHIHNRPVWALAFSPDGKTLASGSCDKAIILCSTTLLRHVASLPIYSGMPKDFTQEVRVLRFSPDGNNLAAVLGDGTLRFFRAAPFAVTDEKIAKL